MNFRTELQIPPSKEKIRPETRLLSVGSCFAERIAKHLKNSGLETNNNPFGTIFNPLSIFELLTLARTGRPLPQEMNGKNGEVFFNFLLHSDFSALSQDRLQEKSRKMMADTAHFFNEKATFPENKFLLITFGTAFVFERKANGRPVANCHKLPAELFSRRLLSPEEITESAAGFFDKIGKETTILLTVSPVRHLRDGLEDNFLSKAILRLACHRLSERFENVQYFPAFELLHDDLRDYRFYAKDLVQPNEQAEEYIFEKFKKAYFSEEMMVFAENRDRILKALAHRPLHPASEAHRKFLLKTAEFVRQSGGKDRDFFLEQIREKLAAAGHSSEI